jgi:translation initiation factor IF-1
MPAPGAIAAEGVIVEALSGGAWRVQLANGHRLVARPPRRRAAGASLAVGQAVALRLSPFDLSKGLIILK